MKNTIKVGDKVGYRSVGAGIVKGVVKWIEIKPYGMRLATIRVTSRKNKIYPCGHVFEGSMTFMFKR